MLFFLTSTGIAMAGDNAKNKTDSNNSKTTGLYDNVTILQEQINSLTERLNRIESLHDVGDRFTDMDDGTILDNDSGLIWLKDANCFGKKIWSDAMALAASLKDGQCGLNDGSAATDWRLPTINEWTRFVSWAVYDTPALVNTVGDAKWSEGDAFNRVQSDVYWSMTEGGESDLVWWIFMKYGTEDQMLKNNPFGAYVWPVRK